MANKQKESKQRDLESGDNPEERKKTSEKISRGARKGDGARDLESGDNPSERKRTAGKQK